MFKRRKRRFPGLNTTSTADISFMMLIFFLVTTSMDTDKGLARKLPPKDNQKRVEVTDVTRADLLRIAIAADGTVRLDSNAVAIDTLRAPIIRHITRRGSHHLLSLETSPDASYDAYFAVQNEVVAAYRTVRHTLARRKYHKEYGELTPEERDDINALCPQRLAENYDAPGKEGGEP